MLCQLVLGVQVNDNDTLMRQLRRRGYDTEKHNGHWKIRWHGRLVTGAGGSPAKNKRSLDNLKARIRQFEREQGISDGQGTKA